MFIHFINEIINNNYIQIRVKIFYKIVKVDQAKIPNLYKLDISYPGTFEERFILIIL